MRHLDLFSGIGGFALAASWVWGEDHNVISFVEIDPFCQKVLKTHWPAVPIHEDIRSFLCGLSEDAIAEDTTKGQDGMSKIAPVDLLTGGFPCQDISNAGFCEGLSGERSGLWGEMLRVIRLVLPRYIVVENVSALVNRGLPTVLSNLAESGYDARWDVLPAAAIGSRQLRERLFIVATTGSLDNPNSFDKGCFNRQAEAYWRWSKNTPIRSCFDGGAWAREPRMERVAYGIPNRVDRLKALGNAIVPQVVAPIFEAIKLIEAQG